MPARPQLKAFCHSMDGLGLRNYIVNHRPKERLVIRDELRDAFKCSRDAATIVLDALEGFLVPNSKGDKDLQLLNVRKACIVLFEGLMESKVEILLEVRERAKSLALDWKEKVSTDGSNTYEPFGFLYLVANYGLVDVFNMDDLFDMAVIVAAKFVEGVRLFRLLGFGDKMSDLIQKLISKGKQLQAVKYTMEFELADKFPPVLLLTEFVDEAKKNSQKIRKDGKHSLQSLNEAIMKEMGALTSVLKLIEERKLEAESLKQSIMKRIEALEKEKANRKKQPGTSSAPKPQPQNLSGIKRPRATTHAHIPNNVAFTCSANNPTIHQAVDPRVVATSPAASLQQSYSSAPTLSTIQSHIYNAYSTVQARQQPDLQFVPSSQIIIPNVATTTISTVPAYQQSYKPGSRVAKHNVAVPSDAVPAYQQSYLQPASSLADNHTQYSSSQAAGYGLAGSTAVAPYASSLAGGLFGSAEASLGIAGRSTHGQPRVYPTDPNTGSSYYGGSAMPPQYHPTYRP